MSFINIKDLLKSSLVRNRIKPQGEATNVLSITKDIIKQVWGKEVADLVQPKYVKEMVLYVSCGSPTAANALSLAKKKLVEEINKQSGEKVIEDIVFWQ